MCEFQYIRDNESPTCPFLKFDQCPYAWWCTHDHVWKNHDGMDKCGLSRKMSIEGWHPVKEQLSDGRVVLYWGTNGDTITTPPTDMYKELPVFIRVGEHSAVVDELFD